MEKVKNYFLINNSETLMKEGSVFWITGLAGAGKTTIGKKLYSFLKTKKTNVVFLDGDNLREVLRASSDYSKDQRLSLAMTYSRLCKMLSSQGLDVICSTISMFEECRQWNRKSIKTYKEIYIKVPIDLLKKRNQKGLYSNVKDVVGLDMEFDEPKHSDLVLDNKGVHSIDSLFEILCKRFNL